MTFDKTEYLNCAFIELRSASDIAQSSTKLGLKKGIAIGIYEEGLRNMHFGV